MDVPAIDRFIAWRRHWPWTDSMLYFSNSIALHIFSEPLFTLLLTGFVALLVVWLDQPALLFAAAAGLLLGAAALVRPIAQWACIPVLLVMAWRLWPLPNWCRQVTSPGGGTRHLVASLVCTQ